MLETDSGYVNGSLAEKSIYPERHFENKSKSSAPNRAKSFKKAKASRFVPMITIAFCLGVALVILYRYAYITEQDFKLNTLAKQYRTLKDENNHLRLDIQSSIRVSEIEKLARERLGMKKPEKSQIVYVSIPKTDQTIVAENILIEDTLIENNEKKGSLASIVDGINRLISFIY